MTMFVAYCRVSTAKQGTSGLGLEAQTAAIQGFLGKADRIIGSFTEVESGKRTDRPELAKAIALCRRAGATLLVAKMDRLARNAAFLLGLQAAGVEFIAADMPTANRLTVGIMAVVAEEEARMISARTKAALAAAKARGVKLGGRRENAGDLRVYAFKGATASADVRQAKASHFRYAMMPKVKTYRDQGMSLREVADALNGEGMVTPRGCQWTAMAVSRVLAERVVLG